MGHRLSRALDLFADHIGDALFVVFAIVAVGGMLVGVVAGIVSVL